MLSKYPGLPTDMDKFRRYFSVFSAYLRRLVKILSNRYSGHSISHFIHHLKSVLALTSLVVLLHSFHLLDGLDALFLYAANGGTKTVETAPKPRREIGSSIVLQLTDRLYAETFQLRSPLDRGVLRQILETIIKAKPVVMAVDLDLSPIPSDDPRQQADQIALDELLIQTAAKGEISIVTIHPFPSEISALRKQDVEWMSRLCRHGVRFSSPLLMKRLGVVVRQYHNAPSLAHVAWSAAEAKAEKRPQDSYCERALAGDDSFLERFIGEAIGQGKSFALNRASLEHLERYDLHTLKQLEQPSGLPAIAGRTIFIGGSYGVEDRFLTPFGELPGVTAHAIEYYSRIHPIWENKLAIVTVEVILGLLFAYLFTGMWRRYFDYSYHPHWREIKDLSFIWALAILLTVTWILYLVVEMSAVLLSMGWWMNPTPLILGLFGDSLLVGFQASHAGDTESRAAGLGGYPISERQRMAALIAGWARRLSFLALCLGALMLVLGSLFK